MPKFENHKTLAQKYITILGVVSAYWLISISIVFMNKTLFNSELFNLKTPLFVTWTQCVTSTLICFIWQRCSKIFPKTVTFPQSKPFDWRTFKTVLPVSILSICSIGFGNLALSFIDVSFYFISRSLTTVFNVIFTYWILKQKTSAKTVFCCCIIVIGFTVGVDQEHFIGSFSLKGTVFGVFGSITLSLCSIFTKKILPAIENEVLLIAYYNNICSSLLFAPLIFINGEFEQLRLFNFLNLTFWILTIISGVFGFLMGFITTLQIKVTSPLTHNISGTAKACAQTVIASYWYKEVKPLLWWFSNLLVLFGSAAYARVRQFEMSLKS